MLCTTPPQPLPLKNAHICRNNCNPAENQGTGGFQFLSQRVTAQPGTQTHEFTNTSSDVPPANQSRTCTWPWRSQPEGSAVKKLNKRVSCTALLVTTSKREVTTRGQRLYIVFPQHMYWGSESCTHIPLPPSRIIIKFKHVAAEKT